MSLRFIAKGTGLHFQNVGKTLNELFKLNIVFVNEVSPQKRIIGINKNYDSWDLTVIKLRTPNETNNRNRFENGSVINAMTVNPKTVINLRTKKERSFKENYKENYLEIFEEFRKNYPGTKRGLETEFNYFTKTIKDWAEVISRLQPALANQINDRQQKESEGKFIPEWKHLKSWIYNRYWENEIQNDETQNIMKFN